MRANKVDFNSHIISEKGLNSGLIKTRLMEGKQVPIDDIYDIDFPKKNQKKLNSSFNFLLALERIIISLSLTEITIFRGVKSYILCSPETFVGLTRYVLLLVFNVFLLFYYSMVSFNKINFKNTAEMILTNFLMICFSIYLCLEIERIHTWLLLLIQKINSINNTNFEIQIIHTYAVIIMFILLVNIIFVKKFCKEVNDRRIYLSIMTHAIALNSFLILFINPIFGFIFSHLIQIVEAIYYDLDEYYLKDFNKKLQLIKLILNLGLQYLFFVYNEEIFINLIFNYIRYFNNPYFCSCLIHIYLMYHLAYSIVMILFGSKEKHESHQQQEQHEDKSIDKIKTQ